MIDVNRATETAASRRIGLVFCDDSAASRDAEGGQGGRFLGSRIEDAKAPGARVHLD
jgi:hypothetical protein